MQSDPISVEIYDPGTPYVDLMKGAGSARAIARTTRKEERAPAEECETVTPASGLK